MVFPGSCVERKSVLLGDEVLGGKSKFELSFQRILQREDSGEEDKKYSQAVCTYI